MTAVTFQSLAVLLLSGIAIGAFIDGVRLLKERVPFAFARYWIVIELIGWFLCGVATFYILYSWQDGHWRWVNFFAQIVGIFLYDRYLFRIIRLMIRVVVYIIITPILYFCALIWKIFLILARIFGGLKKLSKFKRAR